MSAPSLKTHLSSVPLEKTWPTIHLNAIALWELEQDEYFPFIEKHQIPMYIMKSIEYGEHIAKECVPPSMKITEIINQVIEKKIAILFTEDDTLNSGVRARYTRKPPTIHIYKSSIKQIRKFFTTTGTPVAEEDIIALHLFHEWFHYLEEKVYDKTDALLPKVTIKKTKLFSHKKRIAKTREIAAHAFTQKALHLSWSPLLLDYLLVHIRKGMNKSQIQETFQERIEQYENLTQMEKTGMEDE